MRSMRIWSVACVLMLGVGAAATAWAGADDPPDADRAGASAATGASAPTGASAATGASAPTGASAATGAVAQEGLKRDQVCTRCHDESETKPILSIYQTKHGVRGDPRTPMCQSCHGESEKHLHGDPNVHGRAPPDVVFNKGSYPVTDEKVRATQCLTCHKGTSLRGSRG